MKRKSLLLCLVLFASLLIGCSAQGNSEPEEKVFLTDEEMELAYETPDEYKGKYIKFIGRVYSNVTLGEKTYFEVFAEPDLFRKNTLVYYTGDERVRSGGYYELEGKIIGAQEFTNQKGEKAIGLAIETDNLRESDYIECCSPTIKEIVIGETVDQYGYAFTIDKIEFAEEETRLYVTVTNNGTEKLNVSRDRVYIVQNQTLYERQHNMIAMYECFEESLRPGVKSSGILPFPVMDPEAGFTIYCEAYCPGVEFEEFVFEY